MFLFFDSYLKALEFNNNGQNSYKRKRYSPFFFLRSPPSPDNFGSKTSSPPQQWYVKSNNNRPIYVKNSLKSRGLLK